jgi:hypothetical protein
MRPLALFGVLLGLGCESRADLRPLRDQSVGLTLDVTRSDPALVSTTLSLAVGDAAYCPLLSSKAHIDGVEIPLETSGGPGANFSCVGPACSSFCSPPRWFADPTAAPADRPTSTLTLDNGDDVWTMTVEHLYAPRVLTPQAQTVLPGGAELHFTWSPSTDVRPSAIVHDDLGRASFPDVRVDGPGQYHVIVPTDLPPGAYRFRFSANPNVVQCDGPQLCQMTSFNGPLSAEFPLTIFPFP